MQKPNGVTITQIGVMTYLAPRISLLEEAGLNDLKQAVDVCVAERNASLVVDLAVIQLVNSKAMEALLDIQDRLVRLGGGLSIANANATISEIFHITGFAEYVDVLKDDADRVIDDEPSSEGMRLGDRLILKGALDEKQLAEAIELQQKTHRRLGSILIEKKWVSASVVYGMLAEQLSVPFVKLRNGLFDPEVVKSLDKNIATRLQALPLFSVRGVLTLATADPQDVPSQMELEGRLGVNVVPVLASEEDLNKCIVEAYSQSHFNEEMIVDLEEDFEVYDGSNKHNYDVIDEMAAGSPVINLINSIIQRAVRDGASDIHIEPARDKSSVRCRIDGVLYETMSPAKELHPALVSRLKVMANLDIAERRMPQDGRIQVQTQGRQVDLRFSSLPGLYGEKVVLRVLDKSQAILELDKLGMKDQGLGQFKEWLGRSFGLVLVTGPTGSGKTTSLYAALNHLNTTEKNIVTIEDPVEYQLDIINQNEIRPAIGLDFAKILKHVLRQDPDIVMVGEIRERETAEIAVQAALTGHLVLSTLHTNDSIGAITRMIDMGVEPFMLSSALLGVVAQRLVRTICPACKTKFIVPPETAAQYGWDSDEPVHLSKGRGCSECYDSGYKGRAGIHELLETTPELQRLVMTNPSRDQLNEYLVQHQVESLGSRGLERALAGETTLEEISRVVNH